MDWKSLNRERILRQILPSVFFIVCTALCVGTGRGLAINLIAAGFVLLFLSNIFLQNIVLSRILGVIFLLGSCYFMLAMLSDVVNGKATLGYLVGVFFVLFSSAMSFLLIWGYEKKKGSCIL